MRLIKPPQLIQFRDGDGTGLGKFQNDIWEGSPDEWFENHQRTEEEKRKQEELLAEAIKAQKPRAIKSGPMEFSSCVGLEKWPTIVWDVNAYYAELGVHWSASNKEIREAYQALDGANSPRLTYIVKQLLNPDIRRGYDSTPQGSVFFDLYMAEYVKDQMMQDQYKETGKLMTYDEQVESGREVIDFSRLLDKSINPSPKEWADDVNLDVRWRWGYYLLNTDVYDTEKLRKWQIALVEELAGREAILNLGIGITAGQLRVTTVNYRVVAFIGLDEEPTPQLASEAVDKIIQTAAEL